FDPAATCPAPPWSSAATPWPATGWAIRKATDPGRPVPASPRATRPKPRTVREDAPAGGPSAGWPGGHHAGHTATLGGGRRRSGGGVACGHRGGGVGVTGA